MAQQNIDVSKIADICRENDVDMAGLFGSFARGDAGEGSDIDILVRFGRRKSLLEAIRLERELSTVLGRKVDLVTEASISPLLRDRILGEMQVIYEAG